MGQQRIKGQETVLSVYSDGNLVTRLDSIQDSEVIFDLDILEEGYMGERSNRFDSIFKGMSLRATGHLTNAELVRFADRVVRRAQRFDDSVTRVDAGLTLVFPGGDLLTISVIDLQFGPIPVNVGGRDEYVEWTFDAKASEYKLI
jgi:hypothetical protein